jgi:hypothetical protein
LSCTPSPFSFIYFWDKVLQFCPMADLEWSSSFFCPSSWNYRHIPLCQACFLRWGSH